MPPSSSTSRRITSPAASASSRPSATTTGIFGRLLGGGGRHRSFQHAARREYAPGAAMLPSRCSAFPGQVLNRTGHAVEREPVHREQPLDRGGGAAPVGLGLGVEPGGAPV